jgi:hypothetical protein
MDIGLDAIARARRLCDRVFHGADYDAAVDRLLAGDRVGDLQQFEPVGADGHRSLSLLMSRTPAVRRQRLEIFGTPVFARPLPFGLVLAFVRPHAPCAFRAGAIGDDVVAEHDLGVTISSIGSSTSLLSPAAASSRCRRAAFPSTPTNRPRNLRRPSTATVISILTRLPAWRSKSERRTSGRSMPGEEISSW